MSLATASQLNYIGILSSKWDLTSEELLTIVNYVGGESLETLTKSEASHLIDVLKDGIISDILYPKQDTKEPAEKVSFEELWPEDSDLEEEEEEEEEEEFQAATETEPELNLAVYSGRGEDAAVFAKETYKSLAFDRATLVDKLIELGEVGGLPDGVKEFYGILENSDDPTVQAWCAENPANRIAWLIRQRWAL